MYTYAQTLHACEQAGIDTTVWTDTTFDAVSLSSSDSAKLHHHGCQRVVAGKHRFEHRISGALFDPDRVATCCAGNFGFPGGINWWVLSRILFNLSGDLTSGILEASVSSLRQQATRPLPEDRDCADGINAYAAQLELQAHQLRSELFDRHQAVRGLCVDGGLLHEAGARTAEVVNYDLNRNHSCTLMTHFSVDVDIVIDLVANHDREQVVDVLQQAFLDGTIRRRRNDNDLVEALGNRPNSWYQQHRVHTYGGASVGEHRKHVDAVINTDVARLFAEAVDELVEERYQRIHESDSDVVVVFDLAVSGYSAANRSRHTVEHAWLSRRGTTHLVAVVPQLAADAAVGAREQTATATHRGVDAGTLQRVLELFERDPHMFERLDDYIDVVTALDTQP